VPVGRAARIAGGVVVAIVLALGLAQLILPRIAASTIGSRVGRYGGVQSVSVTAWPAVKLLWGDADSVTVRARNLRLSAQQATGLVWQGRGTHSVEMTAAHVQLGPLRLSAVRLRKRGDALTGEASASAADVSAALPPGISVALLRSEGGSVEVRASGGLFGVSASLVAVAGAQEGRLVARPLGLLLGGIQLTLFASAHVYVEAIGASTVNTPGEPPGYRLQMSARLR
jgi:LmeA-like phospholipid-binding